MYLLVYHMTCILQCTHRLQFHLGVELVGSLERVGAGGIELGDDSVDRGELRCVLFEKCAQRLEFCVAGGVGVQADGPQAFGFFNRRPKLLRNPDQTMAQERSAGKAIGEHADSLFAERMQGVAIKAVARRDPDAGMEPVAAQDHEAGSDPLALRLKGHAGKF